MNMRGRRWSNFTWILDMTLLAKEDNRPAALETPSLKSAFIPVRSGPWELVERVVDCLDESPKYCSLEILVLPWKRDWTFPRSFWKKETSIRGMNFSMIVTSESLLKNWSLDIALALENRFRASPLFSDATLFDVELIQSDRNDFHTK